MPVARVARAQAHTIPDDGFILKIDAWKLREERGDADAFALDATSRVR